MSLQQYVNVAAFLCGMFDSQITSLCAVSVLTHNVEVTFMCVNFFNRNSRSAGSTDEASRHTETVPVM